MDLLDDRDDPGGHDWRPLERRRRSPACASPSFAGIAHGGAKCNAFFARLVSRGHAVAIDCLHNRGRLYHIHSKRLSYAIGEPNSGYRRPIPARRAVERLMRLDAVLASPDLNWLTTESQKATFFALLTSPKLADSSADAPEHGAAREPFIDFADDVPIGVDQSGRAVLLYLASVPWTDEFRRFLQQHLALFQVAPAWTLRLVFPRPIDGSYGAYQTVIREELETPLQPATILELKSYFEHRRAAGDSPRQPVTERFLDHGLQVFSAPRFTSLYRRWLKHGDAVFETLSSPVIAEALATGRGRVECVVLPHTYRHLLPLVNEASEPPQRIEKGLRSGNREGNRLAHALNPGAQPGVVQSELTVSEAVGPRMAPPQ